MGILDMVVFFGFIALVLCVGMIKSRGRGDGKSGAEDYFLAGRGLSWWLIGISLIAANISAEQFVGMSGQASSELGLSIASYEWMAAITLVVTAFCFLPYFLKTGIFTIPGFLEKRYNKAARTIMALFMMAILVGVSLCGVIYAGALPMKQLLAAQGINISLTVCCWTMGIMAALYVAAGGLKACAWADLVQGTALILGGALITYFAFQALGLADPASLTKGVGAVAASADRPETITAGMGSIERFMTLNADKLHMFLPSTNQIIPWTALVVGLWIPNFYYWGLNQYITQRTLGSKSVSEGQKGIVFAAALKLIIPFIIVFPGLIAFNLYSADMAKDAATDFTRQVTAIVATAPKTTVYEPTAAWTAANSSLAARLTAFNAQATANAAAKNIKPEVKPQAAYKTDSALGLLITKLCVQHKGLFGFIIAALLGAIVSSLAAVLNAASTIFAMDFWKEYINKDAAPKQLVSVGRVCVGVFVVLGCLVSPLLDDPKFGGIFTYIQEFQGYVSPGVLAVFVYGLINRRSKGVVGVVGLLLNPILYWALATFCPQLDFLNRMAVCLGIDLVVMTILGLIYKHDKPVEFTSTTTMDVRTSKGALVFGLCVVVATVALYIVFR